MPKIKTVKPHTSNTITVGNYDKVKEVRKLVKKKPKLKIFKKKYLMTLMK